MATANELESQISDLTEKNKELAEQYTQEKQSAREKYAVWSEARNSPEADIYIFEGQTFTDKNAYEKAAEISYRKQNSKAILISDQIATNNIQLTNLSSELQLVQEQNISVDLGAVNKSASETETLAKYENSEIARNDPASLASLNENYNEPSPFENGAISTIDENGRIVSKPPFGGMPVQLERVSANIRGIGDPSPTFDNRVILRVPNDYFSEFTRGPQDILKEFGGIIFPYTPQITLDHKADWTQQKPLHSNYAVYFYQRSSVSDITISGKFSVQNEEEASIVIATVHLLRSLTKMRSGGSTGDPDSGAPPPVCRLDAHGQFMLENVPVVVSSFKFTYPDNVDYFTIGKTTEFYNVHRNTAVPVLSTIEITCIPVYSRSEMQKFSVTKWLNDEYTRRSGFL